MKKVFLLLIGAIIFLSCTKTETGTVQTQTQKDTVPQKDTVFHNEISKYDAFVSKKGTMFKFYSHKLPIIKSNYGQKIETSLREIIVGGKTQFFYLIEKPDKYSTKRSIIAEEDMREILKAINILKEESIKDENQSVYVENSFITDDYFKISYFLSGKEISWAIGVGLRGKELIFIDNTDALEANLKAGLNKIIEIKQGKQLN